MDIKRLKAFTKIIDLGSISRAADLLNIAQPALSQQLASLESAFRQKLVVRSKSGVSPTAAGLALYRHSQTLIKQFDRAMAEISQGTGPLAGKVSVGLSPYCAGSTLAAELLARVREREPGITLHLTQSFADIYSELIMTGRLDMAIIHGAGPVKGVTFTPLMKESFYLLAPADLEMPTQPDGAIQLADIARIPLMAPPKHNFVRKRIDVAFMRKQLQSTIVAEVEALRTLEDSVAMGIASTILPWSVASRIVVPGKSRLHAICNTEIYEDVSLCFPESIPETEATLAVRKILVELAHTVIATSNWQGIRLE